MRQSSSRWSGCAEGGIVIFDTDVLIWVQRGNAKAARAIDQVTERYISILTYMELLQAAKNRKLHEYITAFVSDFGFQTLPLTENIGHRAAVYVAEYTLSHGVRAADALIAATATENNLPLCSGNAKHYRVIQELKLKVFRP
jgi:predicted nucleic acid-binding protein